MKTAAVPAALRPVGSAPARSRGDRSRRTRRRILGVIALAVASALGALTLPHRDAPARLPPADAWRSGVAPDESVPPPPPRVRRCLDDGGCALAVWSGVAGPAAMSFWIVRERWDTLTATDRQALRRHLAGHVGRMRAAPDAYVRGAWRGAWRSPDAQSGPPLASQVRLASRSLVVLSPGRGADGALLHGRELHSF